MTSGAGRRSVHVVISGKVQGVGFRAWVQRSANALGVSGWVRNCRNGDVEAVFSGPEAAVETIIESCRQGPSWAQVADVVVKGAAEPASGPLTVLNIR